MTEQAQQRTRDEIARELRTKALHASRLPVSHLKKVHGEIDDLLYDWEMALPEVPC